MPSYKYEQKIIFPFLWQFYTLKNPHGKNYIQKMILTVHHFNTGYSWIILSKTIKPPPAYLGISDICQNRVKLQTLLNNLFFNWPHYCLICKFITKKNYTFLLDQIIFFKKLKKILKIKKGPYSCIPILDFVKQFFTL